MSAETAAVPASPSDGKFHFLIVPDSGEDQVPKWETSSDAASLLSRLHEALMEYEAGWVYLIIDGKRALLSMPKQVFDLQMPDGSIVKVESKAKATFPQDGRFVTLVLPAQRE